MSPIHMKILILLLVGLIAITTVEAAPNTTVVQVYCDQTLWHDPNYVELVSGILRKVATDVSSDQNYVGSESTHIGYYYYVYAYGECNKAISSPADCYDCLCAVAGQLPIACYEKTGGWVRMADCMMEYEYYDFS